ncbi:unnamed protein product [Rotaria sp. Silwood2]|nr:unnamed protein product [Rotaria sp. Silwood2]CAF2982160.1 unnamed protein product [Rotaria sp. Silwood2]CAF4361003.1 unnamed protein product [Rotaria sp. Silwood2]
MPTDTASNNNSSIQLENGAYQRVPSCIEVFFKQLIERKPMKKLQIEIETNNKLRRDLNWIQLLAMGLGSIIGE